MLKESHRPDEPSKMNSFLHRNVAASLPRNFKVRDLAPMLAKWYRPRHALIVEEIRDAIVGEPEEDPAPRGKIRFAV